MTLQNYNVTFIHIEICNFSDYVENNRQSFPFYFFTYWVVFSIMHFSILYLQKMHMIIYFKILRDCGNSLLV